MLARKTGAGFSGAGVELCTKGFGVDRRSCLPPEQPLFPRPALTPSAWSRPRTGFTVGPIPFNQTFLFRISAVELFLSRFQQAARPHSWDKAGVWGPPHSYWLATGGQPPRRFPTDEKSPPTNVA